ncbi:MAG: hypothetical protein Q7R79_04275 [bacterium]|nr:hypothetical protein [bacterium]
MTLRAKIILAVIIGIVLLMIAFGITRVINLFVKKPVEEQQSTEQQTREQLETTQPLENLSFGTQNTQQVTPPPTQQKPVNTPQGVEAELLLLVRPFVERFGSYSNQSEYENLQELLSFMTTRMRTWAESRIRERQASETPTIYHGVTTKALSHKVVSLDERSGTAEFMVSTQRRESVGSLANQKVFTQDVSVKLVKEGSVWLVDGAFWK